MYSFSSRVRYSECDEHAKLSLLGLVDYFQDCSGFHTESTSRTMSALAEDGLAWMVAATQLQIHELPSYGDEICVRTWNYARRGIMADRCYELVGPDGQLYAQGDTKWFLFSFTEGRPIRISDEEIREYLTDEPRTDMPPTKRKVSFGGEGKAAAGVSVVSQMLDTNHHVNNAQYIEVARTAADIATEDIANVHVQYVKMALLGDVMYPVIYAEDDGSVGVSLRDAAGEAYANLRFGLR
jgi:acyl-ACP thioesterase